MSIARSCVSSCFLIPRSAFNFWGESSKPFRRPRIARKRPGTGLGLLYIIVDGNPHRWDRKVASCSSEADHREAVKDSGKEKSLKHVLLLRKRVVAEEAGAREGETFLNSSFPACSSGFIQISFFLFQTCKNGWWPKKKLSASTQT